MATNPRIEDLRKRLEKEPGSRLFAQLAEELRKSGVLAEAVRVARDGLKQHPAYPSARMTLGRALLELEDLPAARVEFESVLRAAPDNLLAGRFLADCLDGLGDHAGAVARLRQTLALAPGDAGLQARLAELTARGAAGPAPGADREAPIPLVAADEESFEIESASAPSATTQPALAFVAAPPAAVPLKQPSAEAPIPIVEASEEFEFETSREAGPAVGEAAAARTPADVEAPIPLVDVSEGFELESSYEAAPTRIGTAGGATTPPEAGAAPVEEAGEAPIPLVDAEEAFELEASYEAAPTRIGSGEAQRSEPIAVAHEALEAAPERLVGGEAAQAFEAEAFEAEEAEAEEAEAEEAEAGGAPPLASATLAELYVRQGMSAQAQAVYEQLLAREPGNDAVRARLGELVRKEPPPAPEEGAVADESAAGRGAAANPRARRREALERVIHRLERLRETVRKP